MASLATQLSFAEIQDLQWSSYALSAGDWEEQINNVREAILHRFQSIPTTFILWTHFDDAHQEEKDQGCVGNHYHLLVQEIVRRPSNSATCSFLRRIHTKFLLSNHVTARVVKNFPNYVRYLSRPPRNLFKWSSNLDQIALNGELFIDPNQPIAPRTVHLTKQEQSFNTLLQYVRDSNAKDSAEFISWTLDQEMKIKEDILYKYFYKSNFEQLVTKALSICCGEKNQLSWWEALEQLPPPSYPVMPLQQSVEVIEKILLLSSINIEEFLKHLTSVLDKTSGKRNTFIIKGPTNGGKTLLMNSIKRSFDRYANLSQGITNNFWLEGAIGCRVIHHEEAQFNTENQEKIKVLMEGGEVVVPRKGKSDTHLPRTPYLISCNAWPWCRFVQREHVQAFRSRCFIYHVSKAHWLEKYNGLGQIDPRAWITVLSRYLYRDHQTTAAPLTDSDQELAACSEDAPEKEAPVKEAAVQTEPMETCAVPKYEELCVFGRQCPIELTAFGNKVELQCVDCEKDIEDYDSEETEVDMTLSDGDTDIDNDDLLQYYKEKGYCPAKAQSKADYQASFAIQFPRWHPGEENLPGWDLRKLEKEIEDFPSFREYRELQLSDNEQLPTCDTFTCGCTEDAVGDVINTELPSTPEKAQREEGEATGECSYNYYRQFVDVPDDADNPDVRDLIDDVITSYMNFQAKSEEQWNNDFIKMEIKVRRANAGI